MIFYLVTADHSYTMQWFLESGWAGAAAERIQMLFYEDIWQAGSLPAGSYIFSDLERLSPGEIMGAGVIAARLAAAGVPILNDPRKVLQRYELLRKLYHQTRNRFQIYRLAETRKPNRFPVFLRHAQEHEVESSLLWGADELDRHVDRLVLAGRAVDDLLMTEYCDTSDADGVFWKYGAHIVADQIVPREIHCSRDWVVKVPDLRDPEYVNAELEYVRTNPHAEWLQEMFALANVQYGRIDYAFLDGSPQLWEINTNPTVMVSRAHTMEPQMPAREAFASGFERALLDLDSSFGGGYSVQLGPIG